MDLTLITKAAEILRNIEAAAQAAGQAVADAMKAGSIEDLETVKAVYPWILDSSATVSGPQRTHIVERDTPKQSHIVVRSVFDDTSPNSSSNKFFRGTGRKIMVNGISTELGTWMNPDGEIEAQRLTKETGIQHIVDPNSGDVISFGSVDVSATVVEAGSPPLEVIGGPTTEAVKPW